MAHNNKKNSQGQSRSERTSTILSQLTDHDLKLIKVAIHRHNIPDIPNQSPVIRALENPADLVLHRRGEGQRPIFDREDIVVNQEANLEERIVLHSPLHGKNSRNRRSQGTSSSGSSRKGSSSRSRSRSYSPSSSSKKRSKEKDYSKDKARHKSRSVEKSSDSGRAKDRCPHSRIKTALKDSSTFKLEGIFKNSANTFKTKNTGSSSRDDKGGGKRASREKEKFRSKSRSPRAGPSRKYEWEKEKYYQERDKRLREDMLEKGRERRRTPPGAYLRRSRSPPTKKIRTRSRSRSRSPQFKHARSPFQSRRRSKSPVLHSKRYSKSPHRKESDRRSHSRSPSRKKYSRSPERRKGLYPRSPYKSTSERRSPGRRPYERSPYKSRRSPYKDDRDYKPRKEGYRGPDRSSRSPSRSDKRKHDSSQSKDDNPAYKDGYMMPDYAFMEGQPVWFPGPIPFPHFGMRQPVPYPPYRGPIRRFPVPMQPAHPFFKPRFSMQNRLPRPRFAPQLSNTLTTSTVTVSGTSVSATTSNNEERENPSTDEPHITFSTGSTSNTKPVSSTNKTSGETSNTTGSEMFSQQETLSNTDIVDSAEANVRENCTYQHEESSHYLVQEPDDANKNK